MSKYDSIKFLKETKARKTHICENCGKEINKSDVYFRENIGKINAIGVQLKKFCYKCGKELVGKRNILSGQS